jgi:hypothetical protein
MSVKNHATLSNSDRGRRSELLRIQPKPPNPTAPVANPIIAIIKEATNHGAMGFGIVTLRASFEALAHGPQSASSGTSRLASNVAPQQRGG